MHNNMVSTRPLSIHTFPYKSFAENSDSPPIPSSGISLAGISALTLKSPFIQSPRTRYVHSRRHNPTAFTSPFSFLTDFPFEVREMIYGYVIDDIVVTVDGENYPSVRVNRVEPKVQLTRDFSRPLLGLTCRFTARNPTKFLCISRQFFHEVRDVIYRNMAVKCERRWDFVNAYINGTLHAAASTNTSPTDNALAFVPRSSDIFAKIQDLHLNLCRNSDFDNVIHGAEARRVTTQMLQILQRNMPRLRALSLTVDNRSRTSNSIMVYMPNAWFLEGLLAVKQLKIVNFLAGPGWRGYAQSKVNARHCLQAMNAVLGGHFSMSHPAYKLNLNGETGRPLQVELGKRMLLFFSLRLHYSDTAAALASKVSMLEPITF